MSRPNRLLFALAFLVLPLMTSGCFYHDIDIETVDSYTRYGHAHTVDVTRYSSDGSDY